MPYRLYPWLALDESYELAFELDDYYLLGLDPADYPFDDTDFDLDATGESDAGIEIEFDIPVEATTSTVEVIEEVEVNLFYDEVVVEVTPTLSEITLTYSVIPPGGDTHLDLDRGDAEIVFSMFQVHTQVRSPRVGRDNIASITHTLDFDRSGGG